MIGSGPNVSAIVIFVAFVVASFALPLGRCSSVTCALATGCPSGLVTVPRNPDVLTCACATGAAIRVERIAAVHQTLRLDTVNLDQLVSINISPCTFSRTECIGKIRDLHSRGHALDGPTVDFAGSPAAHVPYPTPPP